VDELTLLDLDELLLPYLRDHPPVHILVAGFFGWKARRSMSAARNDPMALASEAGPGFDVARDVHDRFDAVILDFERLKARHVGN
jgi:hypothetical protein